MKYSVKAVKTFHGHDGVGWECSLYNPDGKRAAVVVEDGWGGDLNFHWLDMAAGRVKTEGVDHKDEPRTYNDTPEQSRFRLYCLTLPEWNCNDKMIHTDMDVCVGDMVNAKLTEADVKKMLKKLAIFTHGEVYTYKCGPDHPTARGLIRKKNPNCIFLNDIPLPEAVAYILKASDKGTDEKAA